MENWMQAAGQLAQAGLPSLGTLIGGIAGGPLGGSIGGAVGRGAAAAIGAALGVPATPEAITQAVAADPDAARVKLAAIEADAKTQADYLADVANARSTTVQLAQAGSKIAWGAPVVSVIISMGFFTVMFMLFFIKAEMPQSVFQLLSILFGVLATLFTQVGNYWLGSSESSRRNADTIRDVARSASIPGPAQVAASVASAIKR
jgi:hypothetical protein